MSWINNYFPRRVFLCSAASAAATAWIGLSAVRGSGLFLGADPAVDARKAAYKKEELRKQTLEGIITDAGGEPLTEAAGEGYAACVLDTAYASFCGMRSSRFGSTGLRKLFDSELCCAEAPHGHGSTVQTTINAALQKKAYSLTDAGSRGSICLIDADTGAVLALAERPSGTVQFDPNDMTAEKMELYNQEKDFWYSPSTTCNLQPGSVQKVLDGGAILTSGISQEYEDTGVSETGIRNAGGAIYSGQLNVTEMLKHSINTYAADVTPHVGGELYAQMLDAFFYNRRIALDWGPVLNPTVQFDPAEKASYQQICIGHGPIQTAPLHLAMMLSSVIHPGGCIMKPYMVRQVMRESGLVVYDEPGSEQLTAPLQDSTVREELLQALAETAAGYGLEVPGGIVAGKTGTATIGSSSDRANVFLAFSVETPHGRRFAGVLSRENVEGSSNQLKPVAADFLNYILEQEDNIL